MARILITGFCSYPAPDRLGVQLGHVIDGLSRLHQVDVLAVRRHEQAHVERNGSCRILRVPIAEGDLNLRIDSFRRALRRQLEGADYDVVQFRDGWTGVTALELQAQHRYATVFDVARSPMAEPMLTDLATATELERAEQTCVRRANLILAPTKEARNYLCGLTDESKVHVVPVGVNVDALDWESEVPGGAPLILYLGSLTPGRGVRVLLRAMHDVAAASRAVLVLGGAASNTFSESLIRAVSDFHLDGRVRLLGEVPRSMVASVISRATVCVAPGAAELEATSSALYPTKILEYMACKRAVVAPRRGTVEMLVRDEEDGLLFHPGDPRDLADKLLAIIHGPALRDRLAKAGYQKVRQSHTASATRRGLRSAYAWLAEEEAFRERFVRSREEDSVTSSITDLGVEVHVAAENQQSSHYEGETLMLDTEGAQAGEVTRVEVNPLLDDSQKTPARGKRRDTEIPTFEHEALGPEEGTDQWTTPPKGGEDIDTDSGKVTTLGSDSVDSDSVETPKTVITAPLDQSLVAGELRSHTPRPELVRPIGERVKAPRAKASLSTSAKASIPPAPRLGATLSSRSSGPMRGPGVDDQAQTRIVSSPLAMIEDSVDADESDEGSKTAIVHRDQVKADEARPPSASRRSASRPSAPPSASRPSAPPSASRPSAPPSASRPSAPPSASRPSAPPNALRPSAPPSASRPSTVPPVPRAPKLPTQPKPRATSSEASKPPSPPDDKRS